MRYTRVLKSMNPKNIINKILANKIKKTINYKKIGCGFAPANIALCKYWGKRDVALNLPINSSLSISLGKKGTYTKIQYIKSNSDIYILNNKKINPKDNFAIRLKNFLDLFRFDKNIHYRIESKTNLPIAAGLASSASGFAALVIALNELCNWQLSKKDLSILARLGSGSASRSLYNGFVAWQAGTKKNGMDSYSLQLPNIWEDLRIGILVISRNKKLVSSSQGMLNTLQTSILYQSWKKQATLDLANLKKAIRTKNFKLFGETAEANALVMHATMLAAKPAIIYATPETLNAILKIRELRKSGIKLYFTQDAGPNLKLIFLANEQEKILKYFPNIEIINPFADNDKVILVDENDKQVGVDDKINAHVCAKMHRAFSIFILRHKKNKTEILLQQRANNKYHSANLWANTCCGHPKPFENTIIAAQKRLREEMGIAAKLKIIGNFSYKMHVASCDKYLPFIENEFDYVLLGHSEKKFNVNFNEVQNYRWIELKALQKDLALNPSKYVVWLPKALNILLDLR